MPLIRSSVSERPTYIIAVILSLSEIMPTYSHYVLKGLVYIAIIALSGYQPSFYTKYIKLNMHLFCNIRLVSNAKYIFYIRLYTL